MRVFFFESKFVFRSAYNVVQRRSRSYYTLCLGMYGRFKKEPAKAGSCVWYSKRSEVCVIAGVAPPQKVKLTLCFIPVPTVPVVYCRLLSPLENKAAFGRASGF